MVMQVLSQQIPQAEFAAMVGVSEARVSQLVSECVIAKGGTAAEWLLTYCERLREQAAGRASSGDLVLAQERAALARAQREGIEIRNATLRGDYAAVQLLSEVLATVSQAVAERFEHLDGRLAKECPDMNDEQRRVIQSVIASARNEWVRGTVELVSSKVVADDEVEAIEGLADEPRLD